MSSEEAWREASVSNLFISSVKTNKLGFKQLNLSLQLHGSSVSVGVKFSSEKIWC